MIAGYSSSIPPRLQFLNFSCFLNLELSNTLHSTTTTCFAASVKNLSFKMQSFVLRARQPLRWQSLACRIPSSSSRALNTYANFKVPQINNEPNVSLYYNSHPEGSADNTLETLHTWICRPKRLRGSSCFLQAEGSIVNSSGCGRKRGTGYSAALMEWKQKTNELLDQQPRNIHSKQPSFSRSSRNLFQCIQSRCRGCYQLGPRSSKVMGCNSFRRTCQHFLEGGRPHLLQVPI